MRLVRVAIFFMACLLVSQSAWCSGLAEKDVQGFIASMQELKPYFELDNVLENGVFYAANQLYGLSFKKRTDLPLYHPDTTTYDVFDADGKQLAIFIADMYARPSKRGGAWMNEYVAQSHLLGDKPVVAMHLNVPEPPK